MLLWILGKRSGSMKPQEAFMSSSSNKKLKLVSGPTLPGCPPLLCCVMQYKASPFQCNKESLSQDATRKSNTSSKSTQKAGLIQVANWKAEKGPNYMFVQDRKFSVAVAIITFWVEAVPFGYFPMTNIIQSCSVKATSYQSVLLSSLPFRKGTPQNKPILSRFF